MIDYHGRSRASDMALKNRCVKKGPGVCARPKSKVVDRNRDKVRGVIFLETILSRVSMEVSSGGVRTENHWKSTSCSGRASKLHGR